VSGGLERLRLIGKKPQPSPFAKSPPAPLPRSDGSERNFFRLVQSLSADDEPARAQHLYMSLRPLHESLSRHQAVMMRQTIGLSCEGEEGHGSLGR